VRVTAGDGKGNGKPRVARLPVPLERLLQPEGAYQDTIAMAGICVPAVVGS
jgi:hypothetical protein